MEIGKVAAPLMWSRWPEAKAMLSPALARSDEEWPEVEAELATDAMQLVAVTDGTGLLAAVVTRTAETARGDYLELYLCGGVELRKWVSPLAQWLKKAARDSGLCGVRMIGRLGWERALKADGFEITAIMLEAA